MSEPLIPAPVVYAIGAVLFAFIVFPFGRVQEWRKKRYEKRNPVIVDVEFEDLDCPGHVVHIESAAWPRGLVIIRPEGKLIPEIEGILRAFGFLAIQTFIKWCARLKPENRGEFIMDPVTKEWMIVLNNTSDLSTLAHEVSHLVDYWLPHLPEEIKREWLAGYTEPSDNELRAQAYGRVFDYIHMQVTRNCCSWHFKRGA